MPSSTTRRAFLLTLPAGLFAAAYHLGHPSFLYDSRKSQSIITTNDPPEDLQHTQEEDTYAQFLSTLKLRYISPNEILSAHRRVRNGVQNEVPPAGLWHNLVPTLKVADEMRHRLGVPLRQIISAYRSPAYNSQCPGASKRSQHMKNCALDIVFDCPPDRAAEIAQNLRNEGLFRGGIGRYQTFIHIDTRGKNADW